MAAIYPLWKEAVIQASTNSSLAGTVKIRLLTSAYTYSATHQFISDVSAGQVSGTTDQTLGTKTYVGGKFTSASATYTAVTSGATAVAVVLYIDTGTAGTSRLLAYLDGFSQLTNGGDVVINPSAGNGWFSM
jgi:hypothetical protein